MQKHPGHIRPSLPVSLILIVASLATIATSQEDTFTSGEPIYEDAGIVDQDAMPARDMEIGDTDGEPALDGATVSADGAVDDPDGAADSAADALVAADAAQPVPGDAGPAGPQITVSNLPQDCETAGLLAPSLPAEAGHYVATVLTPPVYPYAIEAIEYALLRNDEVPSCDGGIAHQVILFALDEDSPLPENPAATGLGYRSYDVPADPMALEGRQVSITVPIPLILTEGQRAAVAIQFAVDGARHLCVATCEEGQARAGLDWWSNAAESPFRWQDLVSDFGLNMQVTTQLLGSQVE